MTGITSTTSTSSSNGSLDIQTIVTELMKPYTDKLQSLQDTQSSYNVDISNIGKIKSSVDSLQTAMNALTTTDSTDTSSSLVSKVQSFVTAYNTAKTQTQGGTDYTTRTFTEKVRQMFDSSAGQALGISFDKDGNAVLDSNKLTSQANTNLQTTQQNLSSLFTKMNNTDLFNFYDDTFDNQTSSLRDKVSSVSKQASDLQEKIPTYQQNYQQQYAQLQSYLDEMNSNTGTLGGLASLNLKG